MEVYIDDQYVGYKYRETALPGVYHYLCSVNHNDVEYLILMDENSFLVKVSIDDFEYDWIPATPWEEFKVDDKVIVWDNLSPNLKHKRHFAGVFRGKPSVFKGGFSSFTVEDSIYRKEPAVCYDNCERYIEGELQLSDG